MRRASIQNTFKSCILRKVLRISELPVRHLAKTPDERDLPASKAESERFFKKFHFDLRAAYKISVRNPAFEFPEEWLQFKVLPGPRKLLQRKSKIQKSSRNT
jgi:hypothetical protein